MTTPSVHARWVADMKAGTVVKKGRPTFPSTSKLWKWSSMVAPARMGPA